QPEGEGGGQGGEPKLAAERGSAGVRQQRQHVLDRCEGERTAGGHRDGETCVGDGAVAYRAIARGPRGQQHERCGGITFGTNVPAGLRQRLPIAWLWSRGSGGDRGRFRWPFPGWLVAIAAT